MHRCTRLYTYYITTRRYQHRQTHFLTYLTHAYTNIQMTEAHIIETHMILYYTRRTHTYTHTHKHAHTHPHRYTHTYKHTHTHTHTQIHTHTYKHTHTHTHTDTHTHMWSGKKSLK